MKHWWVTYQLGFGNFSEMRNAVLTHDTDEFPVTEVHRELQAKLRYEAHNGPAQHLNAVLDWREITPAQLTMFTGDKILLGHYQDLHAKRIAEPVPWSKRFWNALQEFF